MFEHGSDTVADKAAPRKQSGPQRKHEGQERTAIITRVCLAVETISSTDGVRTQAVCYKLKVRNNIFCIAQRWWWWLFFKKDKLNRGIMRIDSKNWFTQGHMKRKGCIDGFHWIVQREPLAYICSFVISALGCDLISPKRTRNKRKTCPCFSSFSPWQLIKCWSLSSGLEC